MFFKQIICAICASFLMCGCFNSTVSDADLSKRESLKTQVFFDSVYDSFLDRSPMNQSYLGIKKDQDKWDEFTDEKMALEWSITKQNLKYLLDSIDYELLDDPTKISYRLFKENVENDIEDHKWRYHNYPVNQMHGMHASIPAFLINIHQITDTTDAWGYIGRLNGVSHFIGQIINQLKIRESKGIVPPIYVLEHVINDCENILQGSPFDAGKPSTLMADFQKKTEALDLDKEVQIELLEQAEIALIESVKFGYDQLIGFLEAQKERSSLDDGVWKFEDGGAFYQNRLQRITTTNMTAEEIHALGLEEVERIHNEMQVIKDKVEFSGDLKAFFDFVQNNDQLYYPNTEEGKQAYLDSTNKIIDQMRGKLDDLFITKPKADLIVKRVEPFREKSAGKAFYQAPAPDGSRPGTYYVNLHNTRNMPKYEMEALAYHEALPGHHMDRSIAQEIPGLPKFRKFGGYTSFIEGWGLYSEYIPKEMGFYQNPFADFGRLTMELWRACRLVVDTGIHLKKWTREEGIKYYQNNTPASERECVRMVERHVVMPGQATAYKIGMIKILSLRKHAKEQLGDKFDIREFHEVVLTNGSVTLGLLEELVQEWIDSKLNA